MQYTFWQISLPSSKDRKRCQTSSKWQCDRLISKIVVLSIAMVATSISSKIRKESTTFPEKKKTEREKGLKMRCKLFLNAFPFY